MRNSIPFASALLVIGCFAAVAQGGCRKPQLGAIRWDAWHGSSGGISTAVASSLGTEYWRKRWPLFFTEEDGTPIFDESAPGIINSENRLAHQAGLGYWAFVFYGRSSPMGRVLDRYLSGPSEGMRFALIVEGKRLAVEGGETIRGEICDLLKHPLYLKNATGRQPLFVLLSQDDASKLGTESTALTRTCPSVASDPAGAPVLVAMTSNLKLAKAASGQFGGPVSTYAYQTGGRDAPYRELARDVESFWEQQFRSTGRGVIPLMMAGWDPRPRIEHPVPWTSYPAEHYYEPPKPDELSEHLRHGINWIRQHPMGGCLGLIYAWNEFDEGGWLAPTVGDGSSRLDAVRRAIQQQPEPSRDEGKRHRGTTAPRISSSHFAIPP